MASKGAQNRNKFKTPLLTVSCKMDLMSLINQNLICEKKTSTGDIIPVEQKAKNNY